MITYAEMKAKQTSGLGFYTHQLVVDEMPTMTHNIWKHTDV